LFKLFLHQGASSGALHQNVACRSNKVAYYLLQIIDRICNRKNALLYDFIDNFI